MTAGTRQKMIVITLVVVIAVLAVTGVSLAVWISGDGEGASYDFEVMGWDDPSVRYLRFSAKGEGGEALVLEFNDTAGCFVAKNGETEYVGAVSNVTAVGYYGIIEELLIPASIFVKADRGDTVEGISVAANPADVVAVAMPNVQQDGGEALGLVSEVTIGAAGAGERGDDRRECGEHFRPLLLVHGRVDQGDVCAVGRGGDLGRLLLFALRQLDRHCRGRQGRDARHGLF